MSVVTHLLLTVVNDLSRRAGASLQGDTDLIRIRVTGFKAWGCTVTENLTFNFTLHFCSKYIIETGM